MKKKKDYTHTTGKVNFVASRRLESPEKTSGVRTYARTIRVHRVRASRIRERLRPLVITRQRTREGASLEYDENEPTPDRYDSPAFTIASERDAR